MRFGAVMPIYTANETRWRLAQASLRSLALTCTDGLEKPVLIFMAKPTRDPLSTMKLVQMQGITIPQFCSLVLCEPPDVRTIDAGMVYAWNLILHKFPDVTHLFMLCSDWLYNPRWLLRLQELIISRPQAKAWWVYRSTDAHHELLREEEDAALVRSMNSGGCFTREEYCHLNLDYHQCRRDPPGLHDPVLDWKTGRMRFVIGNQQYDILPDDPTLNLLPIQQGLTLDLYDPWIRPGERWVTRRSYILNMGLSGYAQRPQDNEFAKDFVGLEDGRS